MAEGVTDCAEVDRIFPYKMEELLWMIADGDIVDEIEGTEVCTVSDVKEFGWTVDWGNAREVKGV